jgi:hypothetical protein
VRGVVPVSCSSEIIYWQKNRLQKEIQCRIRSQASPGARNKDLPLVRIGVNTKEKASLKTLKSRLKLSIKLLTIYDEIDSAPL